MPDRRILVSSVRLLAGAFEAMADSNSRKSRRGDSDGLSSPVQPLAQPPTVDAATMPVELSIAALLEMQSQTGFNDFVESWASNVKAYVDQTLIQFLHERQAKIGFLYLHQ